MNLKLLQKWYQL